MSHPAIPRRCANCPHFENEHDPAGPCRARIAVDASGSQPCDCVGYGPRAENPRTTLLLPRQNAEPTRALAPDAITDRMAAIAGKARDAGLHAPAGPDVVTRLQQQERHRQAEGERHRWLDRIDAVPTRFRRLPTGWRPDPQVSRWLAHVEGGGTESLVLLGGVGTGKTTQAFAAWTHLVRHGVGRPEWVTVPDLLDGLRPGREARVDLPQLQTAGLLLLDDLAAERESEWTTELLYRLLDYRYAWERPTIITSNVPPADIAAKLGDRIASRLAGMCRTVVLEGADRRRARP